MAARSQTRQWGVVVAAFVGLMALALASSWIMRRVLDRLIDERADAILFGLVFGAGSIAMLVGAGMYSQFRRRGRRSWIVIVSVGLGGSLLVGAALGGTGGRRATAGQLESLERDLHGFREYFLGAALAAVVLFAIVSRVMARKAPGGGGDELLPPQT